MGNQGLTHIEFLTNIAVGADDVYKTVEAIKLYGGNVLREPGPLPGVNTNIVACVDPNGWKTKADVVWNEASDEIIKLSDDVKENDSSATFVDATKPKEHETQNHGNIDVMSKNEACISADQKLQQNSLNICREFLANPKDESSSDGECDEEELATREFLRLSSFSPIGSAILMCLVLFIDGSLSVSTEVPSSGLLLVLSICELKLQKVCSTQSCAIDSHFLCQGILHQIPVFMIPRENMIFITIPAKVYCNISKFFTFVSDQSINMHSHSSFLNNNHRNA